MSAAMNLEIQPNYLALIAESLWAMKQKMNSDNKNVQPTSTLNDQHTQSIVSHLE